MSTSTLPACADPARSDAWTRTALAERRDVPLPTLMCLLTDPDRKVRTAAAARFRMPEPDPPAYRGNPTAWLAETVRYATDTDMLLRLAEMATDLVASGDDTDRQLALIALRQLRGRDDLPDYVRVAVWAVSQRTTALG